MALSKRGVSEVGDGARGIFRDGAGNGHGTAEAAIDGRKSGRDVP